MSLRNLLATLTLFTCVAFTQIAVRAEIPNTPEFENFVHLLERSPFKIKVNQMVQKVEKPKPPVDYFLRGVTKLENAWMVVMFDRKKPKENIIIKQGVKSSSNIELLDVAQDKDNYKLTTAKVKVGSQELTIGYNTADLEKSLPKTPIVSTNQKSPANLAPSVPIQNSPQVVTQSKTAEQREPVTANPLSELPEGERRRTRPVFKKQR